MSTICITGRLPEISIAELESLYGAKYLTRIGDHALVEGEVNFMRLGGSIKIAKHLTTIDTINAQKVFDYCRKALPEHMSSFPEGKIKLGVSMYGLDMPIHKLNANVLSLKSIIKSAGRSVRAVPNTEPALSSAQTFHNSLTSALGLELVFVSDGISQTYLGQVTHVQDIDDYTIRDRGRPKRDAFVGMLPPKLAQTIINLASGSSDVKQLTVIDPFCGTGVILQEALLMGSRVIGTDISERMVDFSTQNLKWLQENRRWNIDKNQIILLKKVDATTYNWQIDKITTPKTVFATEGFLGQPLGGQQPSSIKLKQIINDCNTVMLGFLKNIAAQTPAGTRLCVAAPAWVLGGEIHNLPLIKDIPKLGFNWINFSHIDTSSLLYNRDDQTTARKLLVLERS